ncbi:MAG: hypothetical protein LBM25_00760 [Bacteroidales bacterium]|jgi:hypothetical protein|nr:hypothetical protein [Bacteroidales bacterium]
MNKYIKYIKYTLYTLLIIIVSFIAFLIYDEMYHDPLDDKHIKMLFPNDEVSLKMIHTKDFIGFGKDFFDIYVYKVNNASIKSNYPQFTDKWLNVKEDIITSKWLKCPIDSATLLLYKREIDYVIRDDNSKYKLSKDMLIDKNNYYSYIFVAYHEKYFFLYKSKDNYLYYIRKRI